MHTEECEYANQELRDIDEAQIRQGKPILSVVVVHDDGSPTSVTLESIEKYGLAHENEERRDTLSRLLQEAQAYYSTKH